MKNSLSCLVLAFSLSVSFSQVKKGNTYVVVKVDTVYGITMYEKLNFPLGGDSMRNDKKGYAAVGWYEDYYANGQLLHRGLYDAGQLVAYKNYYDNGQLEREFKRSKINAYNMKLYYGTGVLKSDIDYIGNAAQKWQDYYPNGQLEFIEEFDKSFKHHIQRCFYFASGKPETELKQDAKKKGLYYQSEYYENGKKKAEGPLKWNEGISDYQKTGAWKYYDETGKLTSEATYVKGELSSEKKYD